MEFETYADVIDAYNADDMGYSSLTDYIKDQNINGTKVRFQKVIDLPSKDLRKLVDSGKKEISEGIVIIFATKDNKILNVATN